MTPESIENALKETIRDGRLSRGETKALREVIGESDLEPKEFALLRTAAFKMAHEWGKTRPMSEVLEWLEDVTALLEPKSSPRPTGGAGDAAVAFSPGSECLDRILAFVARSLRTLDVCVFTITDDRIAKALIDARKKRVKVRLVTDDEKALDLGSDIERLGDFGIEIAVDREGHMHHKFAISDQTSLLTGSYNWTRGAAEANHENIIITAEPRIVTPFVGEFERLWGRYGGR